MSEQPTPHYCADGSDCNHAAATSDGMTWLTEPQASIVGYTVAVPTGYQYAATALGVELAAPTAGKRGVALTELAARQCYASFAHPNPATANTAAHIANLFSHRHGGPAEADHIALNLSASRWVIRELLRHKVGFAVAGETSQRYVGMPPRFCVPHHIQADPAALSIFKAAATASYHAYSNLLVMLLAQGLPHKQVREAARAILPEACETHITLDGSARSWRWLIEARTSPAAATDTRILAGRIYHLLATHAPEYFQDATITSDDGLLVVKFKYSKV